MSGMGGLEIYKVPFTTIINDDDLREFQGQLELALSRVDSSCLGIDLSETLHVNSKLLGALVKVNKRVRAQKGRLVLFGINPAVEKVLQVTQLDKLIEIVDTEAAVRNLLDN
jgi:anti-anti-sigma factor